MKKDTLSIISILLYTRFFLGQILPIPENIEQIKEVDEFILLFCDLTLDSSKFNLLHKTFKATRLTMANCIVFNCTNIELLAANTEKNNKFNVLTFNTIVKKFMY